MEEEKKENLHEEEHSHEHNKKVNLTEKFRENPWVLSTLICGALAIILLVLVVSGGITGKTISSETAGETFLSYIQTQGASSADIELTEVSIEKGLYKISFDYKGEPYPISYYMTKDGSLMGIMSPISEESESTSQEVPKSDKPVVELYVYTYCPYGLQMEKAIAPVVKLFGDKIEYKIRQIGAMHGEYEEVEAKRQLCIEKSYPDKFFDYVLAFAEDTSCSTGADTCLNAKLNSLYKKFGFDASTINSCMTSDGETMYNAEVSNSNSNGVSGSPTTIINGVTVSLNRNPEAVKGAICNAFNEVPSECSKTLSTASASAGFGTSTTSSSSSSASC